MLKLRLYVAKFAKADHPRRQRVLVTREDGVRQHYWRIVQTELDDNAPTGTDVLLEGFDGHIRHLYKIAELKPSVMRACGTPKKSVWFDAAEMDKDLVRHPYIRDPRRFAAAVASDPERITLASGPHAARQRYFYKPFAEVKAYLKIPFSRPAFNVMEFLIPTSVRGYNFIRSSYMRHYTEERVVWQRSQR